MQTTEILTREQEAAECALKISRYKDGIEALSPIALEARKAMAVVIEKQYWKDHYMSPQEWLQEECGISRSWAYELSQSHRIIAQIEDAAANSPVSKPLLKEKNKAVLDSLPNRQIKQLGKITPKKAAKIVVKAIEDKSNRSVSQVIDDELEALPVIKTVPSKLKVATGPHPVLLAIDNKWEQIKREIAMFPVKPADVYKQLREAVEKVL